LIFGTLSVPAVSPISSAPGISGFGMDCQPPEAMVRAPYASTSPPSSSARFRGWCLNCWKASNGLRRGSA
jgi:hypothetical protein